MVVSVITPFYEGEKHLKNYIDSMRNSAAALGENELVEVLFVNDSPWIDLGNILSDYLSKNIPVANIAFRQIANEKNLGIHAGRIAGLSECKGEYVIFLDQDDVLSKDAFRTYFDELKKQPDIDVLVSNARLEQPSGELLWFRTNYHKAQISKLDTYCSVGIQMVSPGQTIIKKSVIPSAWTTNVMKKNGADDYFLWLLLLANNAKFAYVDKALYTHCYTGENISSDTKVTDTSAFEMIEFLEKDDIFPSKKAKKLKRMLIYKDSFRNGNAIQKIVKTICNLDIFIPNLIFKLNSKTPYGFNRG